jgi:hypothetical protein
MVVVASGEHPRQCRPPAVSHIDQIYTMDSCRCAHGCPNPPVVGQYVTGMDGDLGNSIVPKSPDRLRLGERRHDEPLELARLEVLGARKECNQNNELPITNEV